MNQEFIDKWVKALESDKYQQTIGVLNDGKGFCCLGVICELVPDISKTEYHNGVVQYGKERNYSTLPKEAKEAIGSDNSLLFVKYNGDMTSVASLNDNNKLSFKEIASLIKEGIYDNPFNLEV